MIEERDLDAPIGGMRFQRGRPFGSGSWPAGSAVALHIDSIHLAPRESEGWSPLCGKRESPFGFTEEGDTRTHGLLCEQCVAVCLSGFGATA